MSGGFGVHIGGGCTQWIIVAVLAVGVMIALVVGVLLGSADMSAVRAAHGSAHVSREDVCLSLVRR